MKEIAILLTIYLIEYLFQKKKKKRCKLLSINMIKGFNTSKSLTKHISYDCRYKLEDKKVIQNKNETMKSFDVKVKK